jgi:hypothetical protein
MFIISDFHDYYDVGMQNGIDKQLPYRRFQQEVCVTVQEPKNNWMWSRYRRERYKWSFYVIGFAGKVYPAIHYFLGADSEPTFCYDYDQLDDPFYDYYVDAYNYYYWKPNSTKKLEGKYRREAFKVIKKYFNDIFTTYKDRWLGLFEQYQTAIFIGNDLKGGIVTLNGNLSQYRFQKVLPPMQAYQELSMYVGSYLTKPVIEEPPISDAVKAEIHGFDKFSFRKEKQR